VPAVLHPREHPSQRGRVTGQFVRDDDARPVPLPGDQATQQGLGGLLVAPGLDQDVQHDPILIHGPPEPVLAPIDPQLHLVEVPLVPRARAASVHPVGERLSEPPAPAADRLVAYGNATLGQEFFDVPVAEQEPIVQSDRVADDLGREAVALVERRRLRHR
jgi:hypothetical protein